MYLVAIAWIYVVVMMALAEGLLPPGIRPMPWIRQDVVIQKGRAPAEAEAPRQGLRRQHHIQCQALRRPFTQGETPPCNFPLPESAPRPHP